MSEPFDIKKFFSGLWGFTNYAKVISLAVKAAVIIFLVILVLNVFDRFIPKKEVLPKTEITNQTGGKTQITNVYNQEKRFFTGAFGSVNTNKEAEVGLFGGFKF
ncbi:MAG: hypothetical protein V1933_07995 [Candidatus Omnitrophota bacterium]